MEFIGELIIEGLSRAVAVWVLLIVGILALGAGFALDHLILQIVGGVGLCCAALGYVIRKWEK